MADRARLNKPKQGKRPSQNQDRFIGDEGDFIVVKPAPKAKKPKK